MAPRWTLNRAGIVNVYQYEDETLHFAGGRLLLRGVNGSGKSTAMNMLLPFLLDANVRRIDAAGEQAGVLRSWMLSGRDEPQPIGYLWIELTKGAEGSEDDGAAQHLTFGCGIKANRSTDRVTTWWFITDRRPGIDLALVDRRVPLSADALKAAIGTHAVFSQDQRPAYRREIQARLYGGADLDQHIRLLHIVRNPRVGDRIDEDLPGYLDEALPQLSDMAIDDAAQPLEDLEEHRRNVDALQRTSTALSALGAVYGDYARTELRRRADDALELVRHARARARDEATRGRETGEAAARRDEARAIVRQLGADEVRLREEISSLEAAPAYQEGRSLEDLRRNVRSLADAIERTRVRAAAADREASSAAEATTAAHRRVDHDHDDLARSLADLALLLDATGLDSPLPEVPARTTSTVDDVLVPGASPTTDGVTWRQRLGPIYAAARARQSEVGEVRGALDAADRAETELERREVELGRARADVARAESALGEARTELDATTGAWRDELRSWVADLLDRWRATPLDEPTVELVDAPDLAARHDEVRTVLADAATALVDHHQRDIATLDARLVAETHERDRTAAELAELEARAEPEPPALAWQRTSDRPRLAELVDFADGLAPEDRAGLEGALEASGLLAAEIHSDGTLQLEDGDLLVLAGAPVVRPLSDLLTITIGHHHAPLLDATAVAAVLDSISTDVDSGADAEATHATAVGIDGSFRIGALRGRHPKATAEHIGASARRAALQRARREAAARLTDATAAVEATTSERATVDEHRRTVLTLRAGLPVGAPVRSALRNLDLADERLVASNNQFEDATIARGEAEAAQAEAVAQARRLGATLRLPVDRAGLDAVATSLRDVDTTTQLVDQRGTSVDRATAEWARAADSWRAARARSDEARADLAAEIAEHEPLAMRLATLEDAIGVEFAEIVAALAVSRRDLQGTLQAMEPARDAETAAVAALAQAEATLAQAAAERATAERRAVGALPTLRSVLAVPGLVAAAVTDWTITVGDRYPRPDESEAAGGSDRLGDGTAAAPGLELPTVDETSDGVRRLAEAVAAQLPTPTDGRGPTSAESVRQSLRQRRDSLGAGWDAEDHQADDELPLSVEVNGPLGRMSLAAAGAEVAHSLARQSGLLTAQQDQALRNLLQGLVAKEVAEKLHAAGDLVALMNRRLDSVSTSHGIGARLRWRRRDDLDGTLTTTIDLLAKPADLRTVDEDKALVAAMSERIADARRAQPDATYRELIAEVLDYRRWHEMAVLVRRPGQNDQRLTRRTPLSEGEKKMVSYLPLFAAVAASADALAAGAPDAPRFVLLDDAFAKVSEDNHAGLWGLLVELDLDVIATSERLWGTHATVPALAITEVVRDAELGVIVLEHARWDGTTVSRP